MALYDKASLVLIPSGTKEGTIFSQKPTNGDGDFTFSRSTSATRVGSSGYIEKETQNLLLQSNQFDTTWGSTDGVTGSQAGYDGSNDAWLFTYATNPAIVSQANTNSGVQTYSVYAKGNTNNGLRLYAFGSSNCFGYFDLNAGSVEVTQNLIDATIEDKGNGWYRCAITFNQTNTQLYMYLSNNQNSNATSGNIYIQDAQLEQGLVARDYIETTTSAVYGGITDNIPRLDYTDSSCPSLLLEPQRSNLIGQSEYFNTFWSISANVSITDNYATSPEGFNNASRWVSSGGSYPQISRLISGLTIGQSYTASFYVKSDGTSQIQQTAWFTGFAGTTFTPSNEWVRITNTFTATATTHAFVLFTNSAAAAASSYLLYGVQVEQGSYATSYIPTYGSAVTAAEDAAIKTGISDLINDGDGTLFMEVTPNNFEGDQRFGISDNIGANRIVLRLFNPSNLQLSCVINSTTEVSITNSGYSSGNTYKIAGAWKDNDAVIYINGVQVATDTNCNITPSNPLTRISFDNGIGTAKWKNPVSQAMYFPTRLTNEELAALTTI